MKKHEITSKHIQKIFQKIFDNRQELKSSELIKSKGFEIACMQMKKYASVTDVNDLLLYLKVFIYYEFGSNHYIVQVLLNNIKDRLNELSLDHLTFLYFMLSKLNENSLVTALKIAIPLVFDLNVSKQIDHERPDEIARLLHYISKNSFRLSYKSFMNIVSSLTIHGTYLSVDTAKSILWSMCTIDTKTDKSLKENLVTNCIRVINRNFDEISFPDASTTLAKLIEKFKLGGGTYFYNARFCENVANCVVRRDLGYKSALFTLSNFNNINYVNFNLLDYLDKQITQNHTVLSTMSMSFLIELISGFSNANYKSENWEIIKSIIHENPALHNDLKVTQPLLKFVGELLSLDFVSRILMERVLDEKFLDNFFTFNKKWKLANFAQLAQIYQTLTILYPEHSDLLPDKLYIQKAIEHPVNYAINEELYNTLTYIFGKNTVHTNLQTKYYHVLKYVISFDENKNAIALPCKINHFEELQKDGNKTISVNFRDNRHCPINFSSKSRGIFALRKKTLDAVGVKEIDISLYTMNSLTNPGTLAYIKREIRHALNE
jgi:FAST kinase domain-containing protein 2